MTMVVSRYLIVTIVIASFTIGTTVGQVALLRPLLNDVSNSTLSEKVEELSSEINLAKMVPDVGALSERMEELSSEMDAIKTSIEIASESSKAPAAVNSSEIVNIMKYIKVINAKLDGLKDLADEINQLENEMESLKAASVQPSLEAELDRPEYNPGDSLTVSGVGLPNTPVKVLLADAGGVTISEGSTIPDSAGKFIFTIQLSASLSSGVYTVSIGQEQDMVERDFRIAEAAPATQDLSLTLSVDRSEVERGDEVLISGTADANLLVDLDIFDDRNIQIARTSVISDSSGNFRYPYRVDSDSRLGTYTAKATYGDKEASLKFEVVSSAAPPTSEELAVRTDKSEYSRGELVIITGKAQANSKATILVEPPSGDDFLLIVNPDDDGSYRTVFAVKADAIIGTWNLTLKQDTNFTATTIMVV